MMDLPQHPPVPVFDDAQMSLNAGASHAPAYPDLIQHAPSSGFLHYLDAPPTTSLAMTSVVANNTSIDYNAEWNRSAVNDFQAPSHLNFSNVSSVSDLIPIQAGYSHRRQDAHHNVRDDYARTRRSLTSGSGTAIVSSQHPHPQNAAQMHSASSAHDSFNSSQQHAAQNQRHQSISIPTTYDFTPPTSEDQRHQNTLPSTPISNMDTPDMHMYTPHWQGVNVPTSFAQQQQYLYLQQQQQQRINQSPSSSSQHIITSNSPAKAISPMANAHLDSNPPNAYASFEGTNDYSNLNLNLNGANRIPHEQDHHSLNHNHDQHNTAASFAYQHQHQHQHQQPPHDPGHQQMQHHNQQSWMGSSASPTSPLVPPAWQTSMNMNMNMGMGFDGAADPNAMGMGMSANVAGMMHGLNMPVPVTQAMSPPLTFDMDVNMGGMNMNMNVPTDMGDPMNYPVELGYSSLMPNNWPTYDGYATGMDSAMMGTAESSFGEWINDTPTGGQTLSLPANASENMAQTMNMPTQTEANSYAGPAMNNGPSEPQQQNQAFSYQNEYQPYPQQDMYQSAYTHSDAGPQIAENNSSASNSNPTPMHIEASISPPPALIEADPQRQAQLHQTATQRDNSDTTPPANPGTSANGPSARSSRNHQDDQSAPSSRSQTQPAKWFAPPSNRILSDTAKPTRSAHASRDGNQKHHSNHQHLGSSRQAPAGASESTAATTQLSGDKDKGKGREDAVRRENVRERATGKNVPSLLMIPNDAASAVVSTQAQAQDYVRDRRHEISSPISPRSGRASSRDVNLGAGSIGAQPRILSPIAITPSSGRGTVYQFPVDMISGPRTPIIDSKAYLSDDLNPHEIPEKPTEVPELSSVSTRAAGDITPSWGWAAYSSHMPLSPEVSTGTKLSSRKGKERADPPIPLPSTTSPSRGDRSSSNPTTEPDTTATVSGSGTNASEKKKSDSGKTSGSDTGSGTSSASASGSGPSSSSGTGTGSNSTVTKKAPKKMLSMDDRPGPKLACLFCRNRKIACGPPPPGSADPTCNQCKRRSIECTYPSESRRGMRGNRRPKVHIVSTSPADMANRHGSRTPTSAQATPTQEGGANSPTATRPRGRRGSGDASNSDSSNGQIGEQESSSNTDTNNGDVMEIDSIEPQPASPPLPNLDANVENVQQAHFLPPDSSVHMNMTFPDSDSYGQGGFDNMASYMFPSSSLSGAGWPSIPDPNIPNMNTSSFASAFTAPSDTSQAQMSSDIQQDNPANSITGSGMGPNGRPLPSPFTTQPLVRSRHGDARSNTEG